MIGLRVILDFNCLKIGIALKSVKPSDNTAGFSISKLVVKTEKNTQRVKCVHPIR